MFNFFTCLHRKNIIMLMRDIQINLDTWHGARYHVPNWRMGPAPCGEQELFNHLHSCIRDVVESSFGVWKMKWIFFSLNMMSYPMDKQKMIVATTMCLHYFICENHANDKVFKNCDRSPYYVPTILSGYSRHKVTQNVGDTSTSEPNDQTMDKF
jgi:hypothetical protein